MAKPKRKKRLASIPYDMTSDFWVTLSREYSEKLGKFYTEKACPLDPQGVLVTGSIEDKDGNQAVVAMKLMHDSYMQGMVCPDGSHHYYILDRPEAGVGVNRIH